MADIILPKVGILNEIDDDANILVEVDGNINRFPIGDIGGGDISVDLSGNIEEGEANDLNAQMLGGEPAENYATKTWVAQEISKELGVIERGTY